MKTQVNLEVLPNHFIRNKGLYLKRKER